MKRSGFSGCIQFILLALILLLLPAYGYACVLPMMGTTSDAHTPTCSLSDCGISGAHETAQKYCETLKKAEVQSFLTLQNSLAKTTSGPLLLEYFIIPQVTQVRSTLSTLKEAKLPASQNLYLLYHTLLL